ncbi:MAG: hypothetical protein LC740_08825, partial [Actinobacteria bacterium]|nr:hypothetical protein [Actinomycetota bacterium]
YACEICGKAIYRAHTGPAPKYCSASHKQKGYALRRAEAWIEQAEDADRRITDLEAENAMLKEALRLLVYTLG